MRNWGVLHKNSQGFFSKCICLPKKRPLQLSFVINGEKLLHHLVMVAKLLDDDKLKTLLKKWGCTVSTFIDLIQFEIERTVSMFRKKRGNFCVMFTYSIKQVRKIGKFHIAVVQWRLKNVQKSVMNMQSYFYRSHCCHRHHFLSSLLLWSTNFVNMVTWRQKLLLSIEHKQYGIYMTS